MLAIEGHDQVDVDREAEPPELETDLLQPGDDLQPHRERETVLERGQGGGQLSLEVEVGADVEIGPDDGIVEFRVDLRHVGVGPYIERGLQGRGGDRRSVTILADRLPSVRGAVLESRLRGEGIVDGSAHLCVDRDLDPQHDLRGDGNLHGDRADVEPEVPGGQRVGHARLVTHLVGDRGGEKGIVGHLELDRELVDIDPARDEETPLEGNVEVGLELDIEGVRGGDRDRDHVRPTLEVGGGLPSVPVRLRPREESHGPARADIRGDVPILGHRLGVLHRTVDPHLALKDDVRDGSVRCVEDVFSVRKELLRDHPEDPRLLDAHKDGTGLYPLDLGGRVSEIIDRALHREELSHRGGPQDHDLFVDVDALGLHNVPIAEVGAVRHGGGIVVDITDLGGRGGDGLRRDRSCHVPRGYLDR